MTNLVDDEARLSPNQALLLVSVYARYRRKKKAAPGANTKGGSTSRSSGPRNGAKTC